MLQVIDLRGTRFDELVRRVHLDGLDVQCFHALQSLDLYVEIVDANLGTRVNCCSRRCRQLLSSSSLSSLSSSSSVFVVVLVVVVAVVCSLSPRFAAGCAVLFVQCCAVGGAEQCGAVLCGPVFCGTVQ
jgi:hypothetical protein